MLGGDVSSNCENCFDGVRDREDSLGGLGIGVFAMSQGVGAVAGAAAAGGGGGKSRDVSY